MQRVAAGSREIIARLVDGSRFQEFKRLHGETLLCGFARIEGFEVGLVFNDGELSAQACAKGAHFIELCCQRDIPLVFLVDSPGFAGGDAAARQGIGKHGAKLMNAAANATCRRSRSSSVATMERPTTRCAVARSGRMHC